MRVGDCMVDVPLREITCPDARRPKRVTPKAMAVLLVLVEQAGRVVPRETLLSTVWPDTLPTDDVLTQSVTQLRKAFGEQRGDARYIETIAKTGYRLLARVEMVVEPQMERAVEETVPAPSATPGTVAAPVTPWPARTRAAPRSPWTEPLIAGTVAVVLALLLLAALLLRGEGAPAPEHDAAAAGPAATTWLPPASANERPYRLITSAPGFELAPSLSPDASLVAYSATVAGRRGTVILVQTTDQSQPRQLSFPADAVSDRNPTWSPDGREIAFARQGPGDDCRVLVVAAVGGDEREVARCRVDDLLSFDWTPDGEGLVFGSMATGEGVAGLRVLDLVSGDWRVIDYDTSRTDLDYAPRYSPDGRWIVFVRNPQLGGLWRVPAAGGTPEPLTTGSVEIRGWDWLPDGRALVFGQRVDNETRIYRLDLETREVLDLGIRDAQTPAVAARAGMLAFVRRNPQFGIFRISRSGAGTTPPAHLFASTGRDTQPALAPDNRHLVFTSDRAGDFNLWWADLEEPRNPRMIVGLRPSTGSMPQWSRDSARFLVHGSVEGGGPAAIFEVEPASGRVARLPVPEGSPQQAAYMPDTSRLLVNAQHDDGENRLTLYDRSRSPWRGLASLQDVSLARVDPAGGRVLFTRLSANGLWEADLDLSPGSIRRVDPEAPLRWRYQTWAIDEAGQVGYVEPSPRCLASFRIIAGPAAGLRASRSTCLQPDQLATTTGFSLSNALDAIFVPLTVEDGTDIAFMPLPPPPGKTPDGSTVFIQPVDR